MAAGMADRRSRIVAAVLLIAGLLALARWQLPLLLQHWVIFTAALLLGALLLFFIRFEKSAVSAREIGVIAILAALAAVSRVPFAALPGVQPTTFIAIVSGFVFGGQAGFMVGAVGALGSNFFLGQGPWTPFQMLFWGLAGASAGALGRFFPGASRTSLAIFNTMWGFFFGWLMNLFFVVFFIKPLTWSSFFLTYAASFPFDCLHAFGNLGLYLLLGGQIIRVLRRFRMKMSYLEG
ncbi:MAG: ECF transporter S component [Firmicutes bacterium]|jgi:energy-coupling factor transport system substrate-specific component|nr:ECF transporter S component [Bacillota bacterium]